MADGGRTGSEETVIVVGAGLSGLATALGVALNGGRAVVLEAADLVGGAAAYSGGQVWSGANHVAARQGIEDSLDSRSGTSAPSPTTPRRYWTRRR